jgi:fructuronate reductase
MRDPALASFVERLIRDDIIPALQPSPIDLQRYADETFARFRNPAIRHRLSQIAWDGSQKLPYRLLDTILDARAAGRPIDRLAVPIAAWILFLQHQARAGVPIVDPFADRLTELALRGDAVEQILATREIFPESLASDPGFRQAVYSAAATTLAGGFASALAISP